MKWTNFKLLISLFKKDVDLVSKQFIQDLEVLCAMKIFLKNTNFEAKKMKEQNQNIVNFYPFYHISNIN
jgi:hypothetical protein